MSLQALSDIRRPRHLFVLCVLCCRRAGRRGHLRRGVAGGCAAGGCVGVQAGGVCDGIYTCSGSSFPRIQRFFGYAEYCNPLFIARLAMLDSFRFSSSLTPNIKLGHDHLLDVLKITGK